MITQKELKERLDYAPQTGIFTYKSTRGRARAGREAGCIRKDTYNYRCIEINNKCYQAHRLAWLYVYGNFPDNEIDHINRIPLDNRIINLRDVKRGVNNRNSSRSNNPFHGVYPRGKKWTVCFGVNNNLKHYGTYSTKEEARIAAQQIKEKLGLWKLPVEN